MLKLDIEGEKYKVLDNIVNDGIDIKDICVEYDECFNKIDGDFKQRIRTSVKKLLYACLRTR